MSDLINIRAASSAELELESQRVTDEDLRSVRPTHPDHLHRQFLGMISKPGFRLYFLFQDRQRLFEDCNPHDTQKRERLWAEMTRLKILINATMAGEISSFHDYPLDVVFIDSNGEVYVITGTWEAGPEEPDPHDVRLDQVIERLEATDHV